MRTRDLLRIWVVIVTLTVVSWRGEARGRLGHGAGNGAGSGAGLGGEYFSIHALDLTPEQQQKAGEIRAKYRSQIDSKKGEMRQVQQKLRDLIVQSESESDIKNEFTRLQELRKAEAELFFKGIMETRALLTKEQRVKLAEGMSRRAGRVRESCHADAQKVCAGKDVGSGLMMCLRQNENQLSDECRKSVFRNGKRHHGGSTE